MQCIFKIDVLIDQNVLPLTPAVDNYLSAHLPRQTYNYYIKTQARHTATLQQAKRFRYYRID
ncbi:hypothetical protein ALO61_100938 [Pseudomonas savastanoi pv. nerii]|uniref:Uncharacterized protein n=1 Tax=Pseudomonas savastanoi pv. nerii TaxID=360921 RepID=A0A0N8SBH4_PSESS|nr:hypothetical protein ALO78_100884 [Pseudomonas amygdali pv. ciccaronei]KPY10000.1 hypothetical protein ALO61_100938 [Pseudomonas savastanoi pv. nerii]KPY31704.1 hypothetical protein ALO49_100966 [Pseudomonas savastanoi pv. retacarpa]KPY65959.1 hypothetical protein ALO58_100911 [Pseudomonas savastanoi pv. savastanoi]KUG44034.1 hypothetical protein ALP79_100954 [Pseudomonas savastanoi pv. fraxini]RMM01695.1 hypothetical protein ALQ88_101156 [Pseudomonas savastanoi]